jgi:hypothetical protein
VQDPYETQEFENSAQGNLLKGINNKTVIYISCGHVIVIVIGEVSIF